MGYLSRKPAACLVVSGPGLLHAVGGLANATVNCWCELSIRASRYEVGQGLSFFRPVICIGGSSDVDQENRGAFQEWPQVDSARLYCKHVSRPTTLQAIPLHVEKAVRECMYGRPGAVYIDMPGNLVLSTIEEDEIPLVFEKVSKVPLPPPVFLPPVEVVRRAIETIKQAKRPLVIVGKGAAWSERGPTMVQQFLTRSGLPWLATPGGKGVCTDSHPRSVAPARSLALRETDCVVLIGARLNWMLHFGLPPRFNREVKVVQIDIVAEEFHQNLPTTVPLLGDIGETLSSMIAELHDWRYSEKEKWMTDLLANANKNKTMVEQLAADHSLPLNYYAAYTPIREFLANNDVIVVNEGANTMDIGRTMMPSTLPRRRLDAGTFGTMGVGQGYAMAAALYCRDHSPTTKVLVVQGDSAFGFSAMEIETIARFPF
ncbi:thiamine pyrophosphate enzyme, central domain protein [Oesophagostomum dentatum]|uniref:2-hydroxyacyl-CoA lyase n=1 Tax=Oesophagostomum dentatum TaxID=61180 RepID=A0A0B1S8D9_OESDE|nr:thiamine pyrophosphate enzyme, central domain protein [Oesophagostomum dentatum]